MAKSLFAIDWVFRCDDYIIRSARIPHGRKKDKANHAKKTAKYRVILSYRIKIKKHNTREQIR